MADHVQGRRRRQGGPHGHGQGLRAPTSPATTPSSRPPACSTAPPDAVAFATSPDLPETMEHVAQFSFDHGLLGEGARDAGAVGIAFPGGKVLGNKNNVKLRFDAELHGAWRPRASSRPRRRRRRRSADEASHQSAARAAVRRCSWACCPSCCCCCSTWSPRTRGWRRTRTTSCCRRFASFGEADPPPGPRAETSAPGTILLWADTGSQPAPPGAWGWASAP